ncbi:tetratricopeptide repeat-containing sensor histidine kinase [Polaribacter gangjinensis]|uniref:Oxygen sensor histidine kinase NreB n=1 Tax=Polaribacter gangjinensis TaxID=574710 RepID=A0A2S7WFE0_9FLAO|nr:tetratricopeptide repeat-containing sensor histidine kinase [Polaribacter gangjinensis]PQJ76001.1 histidine kinase [Polaribacter gangjinensis]
MKKNSFLFAIAFFLSAYLVNAINPPIEETLHSKVSFFYEQDSTSISSKYAKILENFKNKNFEVALKNSLNFISEYSSNIQDSKYIDYLYEVNLIIGDIYNNINNHSKSILHYQKAIKLKKTNSVYSEIKNINEGSEIEFVYLKIANQFLRNSEKDSAKKYYGLVIQTNSLDFKTLSTQAKAYSNLSGIYRQDSLYDLAKEYAIKALKIHEKNNNAIYQASSLGNLASIYLDQNKFNEAKKNYKKALDLIENDTTETALRIKDNLYFNLAYNLYKLKDYEAYQYQEKSYLIKDKLRDKEIRRIIEELGFKYDFDTREKLLQKNQEVKLLKEKEKTRNVITIGVATIFIFIFIIGFSMMRQKNLKLKLSRTELLQEQKIEKIKSESQVRILNAAIDGKETERKDIAETLHDNVSALLSSASLHLQATRKQFNGETLIEIEKTQQIINEAAEKIRNLSHTLISSVLLKFGLKYAIKEMAEKYTNSELQIDTDFNKLRRYHQSFEIKTYNIIQEFVNNIIKHSQANNALIQLSEKDNKIYLIITDDGIGFDKSKIAMKNGIGINQIEARVQMMQGHFRIDSKKGNGTKVSIELPIQEREVITNAERVL